ncbi:MAG: HPP family protein [Desulfuromonadales bacterium]
MLLFRANDSPLSQPRNLVGDISFQQL